MGRFKRILTRSLLAILGAFVALYLVLLSINWSDRHPSATVLEFQDFYAGLPEVPDEKNAFVYLWGFSAHPNGDPYTMGAARMHRALRAIERPDEDPGPDPLPEPYDYAAERSPEVRDLAKVCRDSELSCAESISASTAIATALRSSEAWLIQRYLTLLSFNRYKEPPVHDFIVQWPDYNTVLDAHRIYFVSLLMTAQSGDVDGVRDALDRDLTFWRLVLTRADTVLTKQIAKWFVANHFRRGNLILAQLQAMQPKTVVPASWLRPIGAAERSMRRSLIGEWRSSDRMIKRTRELSPQKFAGWLVGGLLDPFYQRQHMSNRHAKMVAGYIDVLEVPYPELLDAAHRGSKIAADYQGQWRGPYNWLGNFLTFTYNMADYGLRIADLEGARRAAIATFELRADRIDTEQLPAELVESDWRNPYTGEPFLWSEETGEIVFEGLARGTQSRYAFAF